MWLPVNHPEAPEVMEPRRYTGFIMDRPCYSLRNGINPNPNDLPLDEVVGLFVRVYEELSADGYFHEDFGFECVDAGPIDGRIRDIQLEILLSTRKRDLWPIDRYSPGYSEDDLFDLIEFLFHHVSKPIDGHLHSYNNCGMHWETFNQAEGRTVFREKVNAVLRHYERPFELSTNGEILQRAEAGFEQLIAADVPSSDPNVTDRIGAAVLRYRRHGSTIDDRRQAVRDLADVLEYLRPQIQGMLTSKDESDLFNLANNFGIRHHNEKQKTKYDAALWLSWMFYVNLATLHVLLRKLGVSNKGLPAAARPAPGAASPS